MRVHTTGALFLYIGNNATKLAITSLGVTTPRSGASSCYKFYQATKLAGLFMVHVLVFVVLFVLASCLLCRVECSETSISKCSNE